MRQLEGKYIYWEGSSFGLAFFAAFVSFALNKRMPADAVFTGVVDSDASGKYENRMVDGLEMNLI